MPYYKGKEPRPYQVQRGFSAFNRYAREVMRNAYLDLQVANEVSFWRVQTTRNTRVITPTIRDENAE